MRNFWRKIKRHPLKIGIVCLMVIVAAGMLVGGNVVALQNTATQSENKNHDDTNVAEDTLVNGQYFFDSDFDSNSDKGVYLSVLVSAKDGEDINRYLKDSESGGTGVTGGARTAMPSLRFEGIEIPQLPVSFFNGNDGSFYIPGRLIQGNLPEDEHEIVISQQAAKWCDWEIGDSLIFDGENTESYTVSGIWGAPGAFFNAKYEWFIDRYVDVPFIVTARYISRAQAYTIDEIPLDATIVDVNKETGEAMYLQPQNEYIDYYSEMNKETLRFEKTDKNTYAIISGNNATTHNYWTIYIDNPEHARQFYVELDDILSK